MWPRGDNTSGVGGDITSSRKSRSAGLSGFVQFMKRKDAENCVREMDGFDWGGSVLRVGWSKAVPLAPRALYGEPLSHFLCRAARMLSSLLSSENAIKEPPKR
jgi:U2-associated protein SR140